MDPLTIGIIGSSLLGGLLGGDDSQKRQSFGSYSGTNPPALLSNYLDQIGNLRRFLTTSLPAFNAQIPDASELPSYLQDPSPVRIPGIPFQIGGGLGQENSALQELMRGMRGDQTQGQPELQSQQNTEPFAPLFAGLEQKLPSVKTARRRVNSAMREVL